MGKNEGEGRGARAFHTKTFEKAGEERRESLLAVAIAEFADKGFNGTSINDLARKAGVSIGSLYSYFPSKEDLFLSIIERGHDMIVAAISDVEEEDLFPAYESLLRKAGDNARRYPELNAVYLDATTQGLRHLSKRLSKSIEEVTAALYRRLLARAAARGELREGVDPGAAAFCLDNILLLYQFSLSSDYYRDRLRIFLGLGPEDQVDDEGLIAAMLDFVRRALAA